MAFSCAGLALAGSWISRRICRSGHRYFSSTLFLEPSPRLSNKLGLNPISFAKLKIHNKASIMVAEDFETVLKAKYPARAHAKRVVELLRKDAPNANGLIYLEGCHTKYEEDNDNPEHFRQRRYFFYLTGCNLPDCYFTYDIQSSKSTLFIPPLDADEVIWCGLPVSIEDALSRYDVDEVKYTTDINAELSAFASGNPKTTVFAIESQISGHIGLSSFETQDLKTIKSTIETARIVKDEYEIALIRKANHISSLAHKAVVERAKTAKNEREFEATFLEKCVAAGARNMAYGGIFAAGPAAATLHYVENSASVDGKTNLLIDAGCEWENYASDITRTFPLTGKFTPESRQIYDIVHKMMKDTMAEIKAGKLWDDIHLLAHKVAIDGLLSLGILKGDKQEILDARTSAAFYPHGLGHYLGLDTHDVGGNPNRADKDILFRYLRLRATLPAGSVVTVEPGIYFCRFIIEPYLKDPVHSKFIDEKVLDRYWSVGGVRIEDNILVTETGYENLTTAPKEPEELEALASGK